MHHAALVKMGSQWAFAARFTSGWYGINGRSLHSARTGKAKRHVVVKIETISLTQAVENLHPSELELMGRCPSDRVRRLQAG